LQKNFLVTGEIPLGALAFRYRLDSERIERFVDISRFSVDKVSPIGIYRAH